MTEQRAAQPRTERFERGLDVVPRMFPGRETTQTAGAPEEIRREWGTFTLETVMGDAWSRPGLSLRERSRLVVTVRTVLHLPEELRLHLDVALTLDIPRTEIAEEIMHLALYAGFPVAVEGMRVASEVFDVRP